MKLDAVVKNNLLLFLAFAVGLFLLVGCIGLPYQSMGGDTNGTMTANCSFAPGAHVVCHADPLEHIIAWQNMVTAIPSLFNMLVATLLVLLSFLTIRIARSLRSSVSFSVDRVQPLLLYVKTQIPIMSPLQQAFSNGIVHPKLF